MKSKRNIIERHGFGNYVEDQYLCDNKPLNKRNMRPFCTSKDCCTGYSSSYIFKELKSKSTWCPDCGSALVWLSSYVDSRGKVRGVRDMPSHKHEFFARNSDKTKI